MECYYVIIYVLVGHEAKKWRDFAERFLNTLAEKCSLILPEHKVVLMIKTFILFNNAAGMRHVRAVIALFLIFIQFFRILL
jgi:hypothetical protein